MPISGAQCVPDPPPFFAATSRENACCAEDLGRFRILRALGLSEEMTAATARRQLRVVFLLPLGTALLHILFASPILSIFLQILAIQDLWVPICGIAFSMLFFTGIYTLFYHFTARAYAKAIS